MTLKKLDIVYVKNNFTASEKLNVLESVRCKNIITNEKISIGNTCILNEKL